MSADPRPPASSLPDAALAPAAVARTVKRSRLAEAVAVLTVVAAMVGALATLASNVVHDYAAVRIAEAQAQAKVCP